MKLIVKLLGILILILGISLLIKPEIILGWMENNMENSSLYMYAIGFRLVFGIVLILAAKESKHPGVVKFFGYLAVVAAIVFIFMGENNFQSFLTSHIPDIKPYAVPVGLVAIVLGSFLYYTFLDTKKLKNKI